jgi:hypothetical protein
MIKEIALILSQVVPSATAADVGTRPSVKVVR